MTVLDTELLSAALQILHEYWTITCLLTLQPTCELGDDYQQETVEILHLQEDLFPLHSE